MDLDLEYHKLVTQIIDSIIDDTKDIQVYLIKKLPFSFLLYNL